MVQKVHVLKFYGKEGFMELLAPKIVVTWA